MQLCVRRGAVATWPVAGTRLRRAPTGPAASSDSGAAATRAAAAGGGAHGGGCGGWVAPLLVSGPRGLAAAFTDACRSYMIDLEEDEDAEEEQEEMGVDGQVGEGGEVEEEDAGGVEDMEEDG